MNCMALLSCVRLVVRVQGDGEQVMPAAALAVIVTGEAKPLIGVMVKDSKGAATPGLVDEVAGVTAKVKSGGGGGTVMVTVAVWVMLPDTAANVMVYVPGAAVEDGARCSMPVVAPAAMVVVQEVSWQRMPLGSDGIETATAAAKPLRGVIWAVNASGVAPGKRVAAAGVTARVKVACEGTMG